MFPLLVNGDGTKWFMLSMGLPQGDPISPYLFISTRKLLVREIKEEYSLKRLLGLKL